jgi:hypothetical protein
MTQSVGVPEHPTIWVQCRPLYELSKQNIDRPRGNAKEKLH